MNNPAGETRSSTVLSAPEKSGVMALIDASSPQVIVGLYDWQKRSFRTVHTSRKEALNSIFVNFRRCLDDSELSFGDLQGFIYCHGPGSILGIRLGLMALKIWSRLAGSTSSEKPIYTYNSLQVVAQSLLVNGEALPFSVLSEYKKGHWNHLRIESPGNRLQPGTIQDDALTDLEGSLYHLPHRKVWKKKPENLNTVEYGPSMIENALSNENCLQIPSGDGVYTPVAASYEKWEATRHR